MTRGPASPPPPGTTASRRVAPRPGPPPPPPPGTARRSPLALLKRNTCTHGTPFTEPQLSLVPPTGLGPEYRQLPPLDPPRVHGQRLRLLRGRHAPRVRLLRRLAQGVGRRHGAERLLAHGPHRRGQLRRLPRAQHTPRPYFLFSPPCIFPASPLCGFSLETVGRPSRAPQLSSPLPPAPQPDGSIVSAADDTTVRTWGYPPLYRWLAGLQLEAFHSDLAAKLGGANSPSGSVPLEKLEDLTEVDLVEMGMNAAQSTRFSDYLLRLADDGFKLPPVDPQEELRVFVGGFIGGCTPGGLGWAAPLTRPAARSEAPGVCSAPGGCLLREGRRDPPWARRLVSAAGLTLLPLFDSPVRILPQAPRARRSSSTASASSPSRTSAASRRALRPPRTPPRLTDTTRRPHVLTRHLRRPP